MNPLDDWLGLAADALGISREAVQRDLLLDLARDVAHGVARPAAPLTAFLVGVAAGQAGGGEADVKAAVERTLQTLAAWNAGPGQTREAAE